MGYPLAVERMETVQDNDWFRGLQMAQPSAAHLQELMRHVVENPEEVRFARKPIGGLAQQLLSM